MRTALPLAVLVLVAVSPGAAARERFAPCPRFADAVRLPLRPGGHALHGDVDGDGNRDRVAVHYAKWARASCAFLLTVESRGRTWAAVVPAYDKGIVRSGYYHAHYYPEPVAGSLVRLGKHGLVVVAALSHGASTIQAKPFWLYRGRFVSGREVDFYGSIAHNLQINCYRGAGSGYLVETAEWIANDGATKWSFRRAISRLDGRRLRHVRTTTLTVGTRRAHQLERRWRLGAHPFFSCTAAGGF
jgi:hypothetical protein